MKIKLSIGKNHITAPVTIEIDARNITETLFIIYGIRCDGTDFWDCGDIKAIEGTKVFYGTQKQSPLICVELAESFEI